jgi:predicted RNase H-like nuclease
MSGDPPVTIAGVDGCKAGWIAVVTEPEQAVYPCILARFSDLVSRLPDNAVIAVDMPIGLPDFTRHGGRGPEALVRRFLGPRQSSVFSIPSRAAVYAADEEFSTIERWYAAHREASRIARETSDPPRGVSIQAFGIFSKIRELDRLLIARPELRSRIVESHPEAAFRQLNGGSAMTLPKKVKGNIHAAGMEERRTLLALHGYQRSFLDRAPPRGAGADDFLDAAAMMLVARRFARGEAVSFPDPPGVDRFGNPVAIWT